jgi:uncharacterized protein (DUF1800 family)
VAKVIAAASVSAANRYGLGARPGELAAVGDDPRGWLARQVGREIEPRPELALLATAEAIAAEYFSATGERHTAKPATRDAQPARGIAERAASGVRQVLLPHYLAQAQARVRAAVATRQPFRERLVHFWSNHFAVSIDKPVVLGLAGALENEAIRPSLGGSFADLLLAVERHPAMILYLDNEASVGPNSALARRSGKRARGARRLDINENLAREILELHTLGVDGGYTQVDVTTLAKVITGWSVGGGRGFLAEGTPGRALFRADVHEPGAKTVLGRRYAEDGIRQGETALKDLAHHPSTARHLATKLVRHFVADEPPPAAVSSVARVFLATDGDLPSVHRAVADTLDTDSAASVKYKTPHDFVISAFRGLDVPTPDGRAALAPFELLGQRPWSPGSPAGWPDRAGDWDGADALMKRIEFAAQLAQRLGNDRSALSAGESMLGPALRADTRSSLRRAHTGTQALALLLLSPEFLRR